jgi:hypothetical protein
MGTDLSDASVTDEELAAEALAADPDVAIPEDAESWDEVVACRGGSLASALLPGWYMPTLDAGPGRLRGWRRTVGLVIIVAFVAVVISGLCSTYGVLELA